MNTLRDAVWFLGLVLVLGTFVLFVLSPRQTLGSVETGQEYNATTTDSGEAGTYLAAKSLPGAVGSILVASSSATTFTLWNATSTTDTASTSVITLKASIAEGTYTLDATFDRGVIISAPTGFNGQYITTYR